MRLDCGPSRRPLRQFVIAGALLLTATLVLAQPPRGFLWEAVRQADGAVQRVLLLATVHVGRSDEAALSDTHLRHIREAQVIAVEADVTNARRTITAFERHAFETDADAPLAPALRARVERLLQRFGLPPEAVGRLKPWALANNLVVMEAARAGYSPAGSSEAQLFALAQAQGKPLVEIEGVERQLALFDSAPRAAQLAYLEQAVAGIEGGEAEREIRALLQAWRSGDGEAMRRRLDAMRASRNEGERWVVEQVIDGRHDAMLAAIERYAADGRLHLVAIGALHWFGPNGLIERLRERGWRVERLP